MQAAPSPAREARLCHRHGVRSLTYVTLDHGNGGILLNLTRNGVAVQCVAAVRMNQQVRIRLDLLAPRVRVNALGEVVWATSSGRCGIRFLDLSPQTARELDEWTLAKLLEGASPVPRPTRSMFPATQSPKNEPRAAAPANSVVAKSANLPEDEEPIEQCSAEEAESSNDNLIISPGQVPVINLPMPSAPVSNLQAVADDTVLSEPLSEDASHWDWLSRPLSGKRLAWTVNALVVVAAWLLSVLVFLSVLRDLPKWPLTMVFGAAIVVAALYWAFFRIFAGASLGVKLAQLMEGPTDQREPEEDRFR
jgi:hypothetical protein